MTNQQQTDWRPLATLERRGRVAVITMRRDQKRNAVDRALADALDLTLNELEDDPDLWAGVLTGGPQAFSAGSDLTAQGDYVTARGGEYGIIRRRRTKPLVAAVEGPAYGGGLEIVLACDLVVAAANASFGLPEVKRGLVPSCGALFRALNAMPVNLARQLILTGQPFDAQRAYTAGLVNEIAQPGDTVDTAVELAQQICSNSPVAVRACLLAVDEQLARNDELGWAVTTKAEETIRASDDFREGIAAFLERRTPEWTGH